MSRYDSGILCLTRKNKTGIKLQTEQGEIVISPHRSKSSNQVALFIKAPPEVLISRVDETEVREFFDKQDAGPGISRDLKDESLCRSMD